MIVLFLFSFLIITKNKKYSFMILEPYRVMIVILSKEESSSVMYLVQSGVDLREGHSDIGNETSD